MTTTTDYLALRGGAGRCVVSALAEQAWQRGDERARCDRVGHLVCEGCRLCACVPEADLDRTDYPNGFKVTTDKQRRTLCRECRYLEELG